jgi:putative membrane protein
VDLGLAMAATGGWFTQGWLHAKLLLVVALTGYHIWLARYHRALARGERRLTGKQLRLLNEVRACSARSS